MAGPPSSAGEPFPLLNVDADLSSPKRNSNGAATSGAQTNGSAVRRRKQSAEGETNGSVDASPKVSSLDIVTDARAIRPCIDQLSSYSSLY